MTPVDDPSVKQVKAESQHLSAESLDECFDVFTQQERVCNVMYSVALRGHPTSLSFLPFYPLFSVGKQLTLPFLYVQLLQPASQLGSLGSAEAPQ